jgi:hypothetical protein
VDKFRIDPPGLDVLQYSYTYWSMRVKKACCEEGIVAVENNRYIACASNVTDFFNFVFKNPWMPLSEGGLNSPRDMDGYTLLLGT